MADQTLPEQTQGAAVDGDQEQEQDHDCQRHLQFVNYEWVESTYDDRYVCSVCGAGYCMVYAKAFLLDADDYSLVEEYTDEIERTLAQHRNHDENGDEQ